jgi:hypothetical protein
VICSLPVCVTADKDGAKQTGGKVFGHYNMLPVYRACLDAEGAAGPVDVALIGTEEEVSAGLARLRDAGASDFYAAMFPDRSGEPSLARTYAFLASLRGWL